MNIIEAIDDPNLLGASIRDAESWKPWRALLAAAFGLMRRALPKCFPMPPRSRWFDGARHEALA